MQLENREARLKQAIQELKENKEKNESESKNYIETEKKKTKKVSKSLDFL